MRKKDLTDKRFGRLVVIAENGHYGNEIVWLCRCDCGKIKTIRGGSLRTGKTLSCGCFNKEVTIDRSKITNRKHGLCANGVITSEYRTWQHMIGRCTQPSRKDYKNYGGRGISVCERWKDSVQDFLKDMGPKPSAKHSLDRIDVNGNYEPSNCRWATWREQRMNQRPRISNYEADILKRKLAKYEALYGPILEVSVGY